jgi:hypothetical protein
MEELGDQTRAEFAVNGCPHDPHHDAGAAGARRKGTRLAPGQLPPALSGGGGGGGGSWRAAIAIGGVAVIANAYCCCARRRRLAAAGPRVMPTGKGDGEAHTLLARE